MCSPTLRLTRAALGLAVLLSAALTLGAGPQARAMTPLLGGTTLGLDQSYAARTDIGWPDLRLTWVVPFTERVDISPQFTLRYGQNLRTGVVGYEPGVELRWSFWQRHAVSLAFYADPALLLWVPTDGTKGQVGLRIGGPGLAGGWQIASRVAMNYGLRVPMRVMFTPSVSFAAPVLADLGFEVEAWRSDEARVSVTGQLSAGPEFCAGDCPDAELAVELGLGAVVVW
ncbi:MAG: hypothetical protein H6744_11265 [Deltaproteobacteria bacterium]|nr:hypothetical protein [Deltaproteobacteria bacterium]MCB9787260.1 hypothetical protein [Deltaproteobacteria bacterium]